MLHLTVFPVLMLQVTAVGGGHPGADARPQRCDALLSRAVGLRLDLVHDCVAERMFDVEYVHTSRNKADVGTKASSLALRSSKKVHNLILLFSAVVASSLLG
eukprot:Selendium_serpulae@DN4858_c1_g1_i2.p2